MPFEPFALPTLMMKGKLLSVIVCVAVKEGILGEWYGASTVGVQG
jgi:hypothetical protein